LNVPIGIPARTSGARVDAIMVEADGRTCGAVCRQIRSSPRLNVSGEEAGQIVLELALANRAEVAEVFEFLYILGRHRALVEDPSVVGTLA
jgi:hypothetical protein